MNNQQIIELALQCGFTHAGELNMDALIFRPEVRDMCSADRCHNYGKNWACPPYCGTLEQSRERTSRYTRGVVLQCTGQMEDDFDYETIEATMLAHKESLRKLTAILREQDTDMLVMGAGTCNLCEKCGCPDEPCRHPDQRVSSMEAMGLMVNDVCKASGVKYNYGPQTMTFTGAILFT